MCDKLLLASVAVGWSVTDSRRNLAEDLDVAPLVNSLILE